MDAVVSSILCTQILLRTTGSWEWGSVCPCFPVHQAGRWNPIWFRVIAQSTEELEEAKSSLGDLGEALHDEAPFPAQWLPLMKEVVLACSNCFIFDGG